MKSLVHDLKNQIKGDVRFDPLSRRIYSVDASIYEVEPIGIVIPSDKDDLLLAMQIAAEHGTPVIARGAATGITGSCLGHGLIIDTSKYLNQILEIDINNEYAVCQPGVVQDRLNEALSPFGYRLGPDTSTGNRATIGGMLANNSAGARSLHYGRMVDHILSVELALTGGKLIRCEAFDELQLNRKRIQKDEEGHIYREVLRIASEYKQAIEDRFPNIPRHVSGYNLDTLLNIPPLNLSTLIAGSEGTLGIATEIKVKIAKKPRFTGLCILHLSDMIQGMQAISSMLKYSPLAFEMIDEKILASGRLSPAVKNKMQWLTGSPQAVFVAEFEAASPQELDHKLERFASAVKDLNISYKTVILRDPQEIANVWDVRKAGLGLLLSKRSYNRAIAFIEDISVAPERLAQFIDQFCRYLKSKGKEAGIYGHIGSGCMHIRPYIDLRKSDEIDLLKQIMLDVSDMILQHGGSMSGEHGDGLIRSWLNEKMFGKEVYKAFCDLKSAFDPLNLMNPGKIVHGLPVTQNLRLSPDKKSISIPTFLDFTAEGGLELAADLCNGNGQCRKSEGVMCPSFQASGDEYDTTRARAQSLRSIIHGELPRRELTGEPLHDVLDLCIECKGCKRECPSQVDMAKMKSEMLYQYQEKHGYSLRTRLFGNIHSLNKLASPIARLFNLITSSRFGKILLSAFGITPQRELPRLAKLRFSSWFKTQKQQPSTKKVVLFNDTYTEFNQPEIGKAAFKILSMLGYEMILSGDHCCGRPLISKGILKQAKDNAVKVIDELLDYSQQGFPIIGLEPSCVSALRDDFIGLLGPDHPHLKSVIAHCHSLDEFLYSHLNDGQLPLPFKEVSQYVLVHGHCHQKALIGTKITLDLLKGVKGFEVKEIDSGCCGVAGSFGYEKEHYVFSMKIGNLRLIPAVQSSSPETLIVASGISCRSQIEHGTGRKALHLAEAIANQIRHS